MGWTGPITRGTAYWFIPSAYSPYIEYTGFPPIGDFTFVISEHKEGPFWIAIGTPFYKNISASSVRFRNKAKRGDVWLTWEDAYSESNSSLRIVESLANGIDNLNGGFVSVSVPTFMADRNYFEPWWGYWLLVTDPHELEILFPHPAP